MIHGEPAVQERPEIIVAGMGTRSGEHYTFGVEIARRLKGQLSGRARVFEDAPQANMLFDAWQNGKGAILLDVVHSGAAPGTIYRFDALRQPIPPSFFTRYPGLPHTVADLIEKARNLKKIPSRLIVYGVEGGIEEAGWDSGDVNDLVSRILDRILRDIRSFHN
ncbi:MAG: hydrogenase maturation protease [Acidobacteriota bacterium]|jgi:hydrogenase maturation protease